MSKRRKTHTVSPKREAQVRKGEPLKVPLGHAVGMGRSGSVHRHKTQRREKDRLRSELRNH